MYLVCGIQLFMNYLGILTAALLNFLLHLKITALKSVVCRENEFLVVSADGSRDCKECSICPPGYKIVSVCRHANDTVCEQCQGSTFSRKNNSLSCRTCRVCPPYSVTVRKCTSNRNAKCKACADGTYYSREIKNCKRCSSCPKGTYVDKRCSKEEDTRCIGCPQGTYSDVEDLFPFCKICTHCRRFEVITQKCSSEQNNICGDCRQGYFRLQSTLQCARCSPCYSNIRGHRYQIIPECQKSLNGTDNICMPIDYAPTPAKPSGNDSQVSTTQLTLLQVSTWALSTLTSIGVTTTMHSVLYAVRTKPSGSRRKKNLTFVETSTKPLAASNGRGSPFGTSVSNPIVVAGGVAIFLLSIILFVIIAILVYVHRCRRSRQALVGSEDTLLLKQTSPLNLNNSYLKTSHFVKDLKEPSNIIQKTFSEPDLRPVLKSSTDKKGSKSWPAASTTRGSFQENGCSFLRNVSLGRVEEMDNISNSLRLEDSNVDISTPSSSKNDSHKVEIYRSSVEETLALEYLPLTKEESTMTVSCSS